MSHKRQMSKNLGRGRNGFCSGASLTVLAALAPFAAPAWAGPDGANVVDGNANISGEGTATVSIDQSSDRAIINWNDFSIDRGETVIFNQPSSKSITANRVVGENPSTILGSLRADGQIVLINRNGIAFGKDSVVDVAGLVATTSDMDDATFMSGAPMLRFDGAESSSGNIVIEGQVSVGKAGLAAFVAPHVRNAGVIVADLGRVALGSGKGFSVDLYGDGLISFAPGDEIASTVTDVTGTSVQALVENEGEIRAYGGQVLLTATAARDVVHGAVNTSGLISTSSITSDGGSIILSGAGAVSVTGNGSLDVSSENGKGGTVKVLGGTSALFDQASIDATGASSGGTVLVGGNYLGEGSEANADVTLMAPDAIIDASATDNGDGGHVILWSDNYTNGWGTILARGGSNGGDGGFVETSSKDVLNFVGSVDAGASAGAGGTWLLDPGSITIADSGASGTTFPAGTTVADGTATYTPGGTSTILTTNIESSLATNDVLIQTGSGGGYNITVNGDIDWDSTHGLTLSAAADLTVNNSIINTGSGAITLLAGQSAAGTIRNYTSLQSNGGNITLYAGLDATGTSTGQTGSVFTYAPAGESISSNGGDITFANSTLGPAGVPAGGSFLRGLDIRGAVFAGTGDLNITGYGRPGNHDDETSALTLEEFTFTGNNITAYANSQGIGKSRMGLVLVGGVNIRAAGDISLTGIATNGSASELGPDAGYGIATYSKVVTDVTLYAAGNTTLTGSANFNDRNAIDLSLTSSSASSAVRIGYTADGDLTTGNITINGNAAGDGKIVLPSFALIRSDGGDVTIGDNGNALNAVMMPWTVIDTASTFGSITIGGTNTSDLLTDGPIDWSASNAINLIDKDGLGIGTSITNSAVGGDLNIFTATGADGTLSLSDTYTLTADGAINLYSGFLTDASTASGFNGSISLGNTSALVAGGNILARANAALTLLSGATLTSSNGDILLSTEGTGTFTNSAGATPFSAANGRWLVYADDPANTTFGGLESGNSAIWNQANFDTLIGNLSADTIPGDRFAFAVLPDTNGGYIVDTVDQPNKIYGETVASSTDSSTFTISGSSLGTNNGAGSAYLLDDLVGLFDFDVTTDSVGFAATADANTYAVTASGATTFNGQTVIYNSSGNVVVDPRTVTLSGSQVYDSTTTVQGENLIAGNVVNGDSVTVSGSADNAISDPDIGTYNLESTTGLTLSDANYTVVDATGTVDITQATLTAALAGTVTKTYDTTDAATLAAGNYTLTGVFSGDTVALNNPTGGSYDNENVGTGKNVSVSGLSLSGTQAGNYVLAADAIDADIGEINPATLTAALTGTVTKTYDTTDAATLAAGNYTLTGVFSGDTVALNNPTGGSYDNENVGTGKNVSVSGLSLSGAQAGNYVLAADAIDADIGEINPATLTAALTGTVTKTYDTTDAATLAAGNYTLTGVFSGDTVALNNPTGGSYDNENVGTGKNVSVSGLSLSGAQAGNYVLAADAIDADIGEINPATLTAALTGTVTKTYDATDAATLAAGNYTLTGVFSGDTVALNNPTNGSYDNENVGTGKNVSVSGLSLSGAQAGNYVLAADAIDADIGEINPATLTAALTGTVTKTYDTTDAATLAAGNYTLTGVFSGDTVALNNPTNGSYDNENVGTGKNVSVSGLSLSGAQAGNYVLAADAIDADIGEINPATLVIDNVIAANKEYDSKEDATLSGGSVTGFSGDTVSLVTSGATGTFENKNVGTGKAVTASGYTLTGADAPNYVLTQPTGLTADITPATLTVAGSFSAENKVYDSTTNTNIDTSGLVLAGVFSGDQVQLNTENATGSFTDKNVGTSKIVELSTNGSLSGGDAGNYIIGSGAPTTTANVTPFTLDLEYVGVDKVYDGGLDANVVVDSDNRFAGDNLIFNITALYSDKNVGIDKNVTVGSITLAGDDAGNYVLGTASGTAMSDITRLDTVIWTGAGDGVNWFDPANWAGGAVPDLANVANVSLPASLIVTFDDSALSGSAEAGTVQLETLTGTVDADTVPNATDSGLSFQSGGLTIGNALLLDTLTQAGGTIDGDGSLTIQDSFAQTDGSIAMGGDVAINEGAGDLDFVSISGANIELTAPAGSINAGSLTAANDLTVGAGDDVVFTGPVSVGGNAEVTADTNGDGTGGITQDDDAPLNIGGDTVLEASEDIVLDNPDNDFVGPVSGTTDGGMTLADANDLTLGTVETGTDLTIGAGDDVVFTGPVSVGGNAEVTADTNGDGTGGITQDDDAPLNIGGDTVLEASEDIVLDNPDNDFVGPVSGTTDGGMTLADANDLTLGTVETGTDLTIGAGDDVVFTGPVSVGGNAEVTADTNGDGTGGITQDDDAPLNIGGDTVLEASEDIVLNNPDNDFVGPVSGTTDGGMTLADANDLTLGTVETGTDLTIGAGDDVVFTGPVSVGGNAEVTADTNGDGTGGITQDDDAPLNIGGDTVLEASEDIVLDNPDNDFVGPVSGTTDGGMTLADANDLTLGTVETGTDLTIGAGDDVVFTGPVSVGGNAEVTADTNGDGTGGITQDDDAPLNIGGDTVLEASEDIVLDNPDNDFVGPVSGTTDGGMTLADANDLNLGTIDVDGALGLDAGGDIIGSDRISVGGDTDINAGGNVDLTNPDNQFGGNVDVNAGGTVNVPGNSTIGETEQIREITSFSTLTTKLGGFITPMNKGIRPDMINFFAQISVDKEKEELVKLPPADQ